MWQILEWVFSMWLKLPRNNSESSVPSTQTHSMLTAQDIITSGGKYPERLLDPSCTDEVKANAARLVLCVNGLLNEMGIDWSQLRISSGFRTPSSNASIGGAKNSYHMRGLAVDLQWIPGIKDFQQTIDNRVDLLKKYGLRTENSGATPTWKHLDCGIPSSEDHRIYMP